MFIRIAEERDIPRILEIYAPYVENTPWSFEYSVPSSSEFTERFRNVTGNFPWLVCGEGDRVEGYAYASPAFSRAAYQWVCEDSIYLSPNFLHRGMGDKLYKCLEFLLKRQGYSTVYAVITSENEASVRFHERMGFSFLAEFPRVGFKQGQWHGTKWLQKPLNSVEMPMYPPTSFPKLVDTDRMVRDYLDKLTLS